MKKLALTLCLAALATGVFAQGTVKFSNGTASLISVDGTNTPAGAGAFFFGLFTAPSGTTDEHLFTFTGTYGTNTVLGRFQGGGNLGIAVNGWTAGDTRAYLVCGWSAALGHDYNPAWLPEYLGARANFPQGFFGVSSIGTGAAGGIDPISGATIPALVAFGAAPAITTGFNLTAVPVPEPTTMALAGLGAAALLIFRRRK